MSFPKISVGFGGFWRSFDERANVFTRLLEQAFELRVVPSEAADYLFCGNESWARSAKRRQTRILYSIDCVFPSAFADWNFTSCRIDFWNNFRLPFYALRVPERVLRGPADLRRRPRFCCCVSSRPKHPRRKEFIARLSQYKPVDVFGRAGTGAIENKYAVARDYRFQITFENSRAPGYISEKLPEAVAAGCVPIYWGDPTIAEDFSPERFITVDDDFDAAIGRIVAMDRDHELWSKCVAQPLCESYYDYGPLVRRFEEIFQRPARTYRIEPAYITDRLGPEGRFIERT